MPGDANKGYLEGVRHRYGSLETLEVLVERAIDRNLSERNYRHLRAS